ncbi:MAG: hypothetical protein WD773_04505 [Gemmatimonadales bacterium]
MTPLLALALLLQQGTPADTTAGRPCRVVIDSMGHYREVPTAPGEKITYGGGGVLAHCQETGTTIAADSFAHYSALGRLDLMRRVQIRDTGLALDANFASYFLRDERLEARNNVVAVNRRNGSVLRGPNLRYWRAVRGVRDTVEMYATSRPTVEYRSAEEGDSAEPYIIVADRIRFKGDDRMWAGGKVTVDRSDFSSRSDSLLLDQTQGFGVLVGHPSVEGRGREGEGEGGGTGAKSYTLVGTRIELVLEGREVRVVKALGHGKATGADWVLTADTIHLMITDRMLQQTFAWGDSSRPNAVSSLNTIQSDSLAIDSPGEVLTESRAFGRALSMAKRDSTTAAADMDWIAGDTLTARFAQETDSAGREQSRVQQILARGAARALTHHVDTRDTTTGPAINYSRGEQIVVAMKRDRIDRVVVAGKADGVHLEPRAAVAADSTRRATPAVTPPPPPPIP